LKQPNRPPETARFIKAIDGLLPLESWEITSKRIKNGSRGVYVVEALQKSSTRILTGVEFKISLALALGDSSLWIHKYHLDREGYIKDNTSLRKLVKIDLIGSDNQKETKKKIATAFNEMKLRQNLKKVRA
jgi:hypothetical protein